MTSGRDLPPGGGVRDILRTSTREDHERLHRHSHFAALLDGDLGKDGYWQLISRLYGFYAPLDAAICGVLTGPESDQPCYDYTERAGMLAQDLRHLGMDDPEIRALPQCEPASRIVNRGSLGGVLYVIEGATLGGMHLDRLARGVLGHEEVPGRTLWAWCRAQNGGRWKTANQFLARQHAEGVPLADLEAGARDTFRVIADWLSPLDQSGQDNGTATQWDQ